MGLDRIGLQLTLQEDLIVRDLGDGDTSDLELLGLSRANRTVVMAEVMVVMRVKMRRFE